MICKFLVTIAFVVNAPTPKNTQGVLKVKQYQYVTFTDAVQKANRSILLMGAGLDSKTYPKIDSVDLTKTTDFKCEYEGERF